jgi:hypothetical protein
VSRRRLRTAARVLLGLAILIPLAAFALDTLFALDVTLMLDRHDAEEVREWRALRDPADDPAEIYGQCAPGPARRVHVLPWRRRAALLAVPEAPGRLLLFVDEHSDLTLVDARSLDVSALGLGLVLAALGWGTRRAGAQARTPASAQQGLDFPEVRDDVVG